MNQIPNLDCIPASELWDFFQKHKNCSAEAAAQLIGDTRKGYERHAQTLVLYAQTKWKAVKARQSGEILAAQDYEVHCDRIYAKLPEDLRW